MFGRHKAKPGQPMDQKRRTEILGTADLIMKNELRGLVMVFSYTEKTTKKGKEVKVNGATKVWDVPREAQLRVVGESLNMDREDLLKLAISVVSRKK